MHEWAELRHFCYPLKILERQGFRVAAEGLHTSQPNLTFRPDSSRNMPRFDCSEG